MPYPYLIIKGVLYGILMAFMIGPVFFTLIKTGMDKGFYAGALLASGIALSEGIIIFIAYAGVLSLEKSGFFRTFMGVAGGAVMLAFGAYSFFKSQRSETIPQGHLPVQNAEGLRYVFAGFLLNILNPMVYLFWIALIGQDIIKNQYPTEQVILLFSGTILTIFLTDLLKAYGAQKIGAFLDARILTTFDRAVGLFLVAYGFYLFYFASFGG